MLTGNDLHPVPKLHLPEDEAIQRKLTTFHELPWPKGLLVHCSMVAS